MFDSWRKNYEKNLEAYNEYLRNDYKYIDYYKNRIKEIIGMTPYADMNYKLNFNETKDLEIYFYKDNYRANVFISADSFEHYNIFTDEYLNLSDNIRKSYKRSLTETLMGLENEYVKEMRISYDLYTSRINIFLENINKEMLR